MKIILSICALPRIRRAIFAAAVLVGALISGPICAQTSPEAGYWWNPAQGGNGFVIEIQGNQMFMAGFLYSSSGEATWVASSGVMASSSSYTGSLITYSGGETLTGTYKAATLVSPALGTISINFTSNTQGTVVWPGGTVPIQRFDFGPGGSEATQPATNPQTGWWWNPAEGGRGMAIEVQGGSMYFALYMYDAQGNAVWYLASGNMTDTGLFQGELTQYEGGLTLTGGYKAPSLANGNVGAVTLQFSSTSEATLTLPGGRQIPLTRFNFSGTAGPTLTTFSPAAAAPAALLTIQGTNIDPTTTLSLTLSDNNGYSVNIPLTAATATSITASVPPYINSANGAFGTGTVSLTLNQSSGGTTTSSNSLPGFTIQQPPAAGKGQSTLALIQANLQEAQKLQTSIKGTPQDNATVDAEIQTQINDLQTLATNVESVVSGTASFALGAVGGVNISVSSSNIGDVDSLILATLQSLASPTGSATEQGAKLATGPQVACMSAEATAYLQAAEAGDSAATLIPLALAMIEAPYNSTACGTIGAFTSAYDIFAGSGNIGIGITDAAGSSLDGVILPGAALFATVNSNANISVGLNALLSAAFAAEASSVQNAIGGVTGLSQAAIAQLIAEATGELETFVSDSQTFIVTVAPPPAAAVVPTNLPTGSYTLSYSFTFSTDDGTPTTGSAGPISLTNTNASVFAAALQTEINAFNSANNCGGDGITCSATVTPFNGTTLQIVFNFYGSLFNGNITYIITKIGS